MRIQYQDLFLEFPDDTDGSIDVGFKLTTINEKKEEVLLWECNLMGLWRDWSIRELPDLKRTWGLHTQGDYFQQTITRHNNELHPHISYTAIFHQIIRENRQVFSFIKNIYSTAELGWLSMGYHISIDGNRFWVKQFENLLAERIEEQGRYRAIL